MGQKTFPVVALVASLVLISSTEAGVYRWVDSKGNVVYSDSPPPRAADLKKPPVALVEEALTLSGFKRQLELLPAQIEAQLREQLKQVPHGSALSITQLTVEAFRPVTMYAAVRRGMVRDFDRDKIGDLLVFLRSPLAKQMVDLELRASDPSAREKIQQFAATLKSAPKDDDRMVLLNRLDVAMQASELSTDVSMSVLNSMARARAGTQSPEQIAQAMASVRGQISGPTRAATLVTMLYTYRAAADADLRQYVRFWESAAGRWFAGSLRVSFAGAVAEAADRAMPRLMDFMPSPQAPKSPAT